MACPLQHNELARKLGVIQSTIDNIGSQMEHLRRARGEELSHLKHNKEFQEKLKAELAKLTGELTNSIRNSTSNSSTRRHCEVVRQCQLVR
jgi:chromosome segregation ATPase